MPNIQHLESLCVIHIDFDIWSGQTRLSPADFKLGDGGKIPPEKVAQLGSKKICDPAKLKGFARLKTETRRLLLSYGMPFMNGFAVPASLTDDICQRLDAISGEFESLKQSFISNYNAAVEEWIRENPEYETAIRAGALPRAVVEKRIGFEYQVFMIQALNEESESAKSLGRKVESLGGDLLDEVADEAGKFFTKNLSGREECGVTSYKTLANIRNKIDGLSFLDNSFTPLVKLLDNTINGYQKHAEGRVIKAPFFYQVVAAVLIMSDRSKIEDYAKGAVTLQGMAEQVTPQQPMPHAPEVEPKQEPMKQAEPVSDTPVDDAGSDKPTETVANDADDQGIQSDEPDLTADMESFFNQFSEGSGQDDQPATHSSSEEEVTTNEPSFEEPQVVIDEYSQVDPSEEEDLGDIADQLKDGEDSDCYF